MFPNFSMKILFYFCTISGGLLGLAGKFPPKYMGGVFSGQALGGIFASACNVVFLAMGADVVDAALFCFILATVFLATALALYVVVTKSNFFKFYVDEETKPEPIITEKPKISESTDMLGTKVEKAGGDGRTLNPFQVKNWPTRPGRHGWSLIF